MIKIMNHKNGPVRIFIQGFMSYCFSIICGLTLILVLRPNLKFGDLLTAFPLWYFPAILFVIAILMLYTCLYSYKENKKIYLDSSEAMLAIKKVLISEKAVSIDKDENDVYRVRSFKLGFTYYIRVKADENKIIIQAPRKIIEKLDKLILFKFQ